VGAVKARHSFKDSCLVVPGCATREDPERSQNNAANPGTILGHPLIIGNEPISRAGVIRRVNGKAKSLGKQIPQGFASERFLCD
jgi:hypothetical protein